MTMKSVYKHKIDLLIEEPTSEEFFEDLLQLELIQWENVYKLPFLVTIESKLRAFQFKINHNIYYTNEKLEKIKIVGSNRCTFCDDRVEDLVHLFIRCRYVNNLWEGLEDILTYVFSDEEKLLGVVDHIGERSFDIHSHSSFILKYYVHICRLNKIKPTLDKFFKRLAYNEQLERQIATRKQKIGKHLRKWSPIINLLDNYII